MGIQPTGYRYLQSLLRLESMRPPPGTPTPSWTRGPTPVAYQRLSQLLASHPDPQFTAFIQRGISSGFRIGFNRRSNSLVPCHRNHPSALTMPNATAMQLHEEVCLQRLYGPIPPHWAGHIHTSPIGLIPKPHSDRFRLIVDLSHPRGHSVNDGIDPALCSLSYASVQDAVSFIAQLGVNTQLIKLDLKNAYRILPIHPDDMSLLGITWQNCLWTDPFRLDSGQHP